MENCRQEMTALALRAAQVDEASYFVWFQNSVQQAAIVARFGFSRHHNISRTIVSKKITMPLYEYHCPKCSSDFELLIRCGEKPECPHCHSPKLNRRMSVPAAHSAQSDTPSCPGAAMGCSPGAMPCCGKRGCALQ